MSQTIAVLGAGSWGTALAKNIAERGNAVRLWARRPELAEAIRDSRRNQAYLPGISLPAALTATSDLQEALTGADVALLVVPSHGLREVLHDCRLWLPKSGPILCATKGIENDSLMLMSEVFRDALPDIAPGRFCSLGGPSFAMEVARGLPTAFSIAATDLEMARAAQTLISNERMRAYTTEDVVGVELGGAVKNVIAIAAGASDGLGFGHNARAGLITRGVAEIARLAAKLKANPLTIAGLSGMGDLVLTCTGDLSRNRRVGMELGAGKTLADILRGMTMVAEGVKTARSTHHLAAREGVEMPITAEVYRVLYEGKSPSDAVQSLLGREPRSERD
jgi:glycerol-3-phosphate dehydrogenase (NAD(P)+)